MNNKIKWAAIQPLTGGMYLGAEEAIGYPAEWILSYKGLNDIKINNKGEITTAANEYNLTEYLSKHNRMVKYYQICNRDMFDSNIYEKNPEICLNDIPATPDYSDLDLVVAVPVCSGLSIATSGSKETRDTKNNNMLWLAFYAMNVVQPKCYVFENAPTLIGSRGDEIREKLEEIAKNAGYSVLYYKTDTKYHENCQQRPRTFVCFFKLNNIDGEISFNYVNKHINVIDYFNSMNPNASQMTELETPYHNHILIDYIKERVGDDWNEKIYNSLMKYVEKNLSLNDFVNYIKSYECDQKLKDKAVKYVEHIIYKRSLNMNYYDCDACLFNRDIFPSVQFRSMQYMLHPSGKRCCTIREYLSLMGHPEDFILYGNESNYPKIGQNVPVKTAKFIVEQAIANLNNGNKVFNVKFQDNIKFNK